MPGAAYVGTLEELNKLPQKSYLYERLRIATGIFLLVVVGMMVGMWLKGPSAQVEPQTPSTSVTSRIPGIVSKSALAGGIGTALAGVIGRFMTKPVPPLPSTGASVVGCIASPSRQYASHSRRLGKSRAGNALHTMMRIASLASLAGATYVTAGNAEAIGQKLSETVGELKIGFNTVTANVAQSRPFGFFSRGEEETPVSEAAAKEIAPVESEEKPKTRKEIREEIMRQAKLKAAGK
mmetsp:Transcript_17388/g.42545  ORF Transcript_17388/g.42545 Transcript_17388/m.42545 type:complete len:237 (+) Transcript_17388:372-1082(+)|eukprot:CAMPEP_0114493030 /NCGR_PEP_ID=MMETSP0109-20121206/3888_1 /TAXON_ID=29199 /ORGANISM="Chlorarachnion reptans, Strain CCCM449" /LENGTH=236 /DNA_ID=CAMNT_0001669947 /DNA_START=357 /DNA_END=1067 /DNA_ORIENTATION=+